MCCRPPPPATYCFLSVRPTVAQHLLSEIVGAAPKEGVRCPIMESMYEYGSRAGFWRLHRLLTGKDIPITGNSKVVVPLLLSILAVEGAASQRFPTSHPG